MTLVMLAVFGCLAAIGSGYQFSPDLGRLRKECVAGDAGGVAGGVWLSRAVCRCLLGKLRRGCVAGGAGGVACDTCFYTMKSTGQKQVFLFRTNTSSSHKKNPQRKQRKQNLSSVPGDAFPPTGV